jgi:hypothetical protein
MSDNHLAVRAGALCGAGFSVGLFVASGQRLYVVGLLALTLFVPFLACLVRVLADAAGGPSWLSATAFAGGIAGITLKLASVAPELANRRGVPAGTPLHRTLQGIADTTTLIALWPLAACMAAVAVLALTTGALPRWLGVAAAVTAAALAVNGSFINAGFLPALLLFVAWTLAASVVLFRRAGRPATRGASAYAAVAG